MKQKLSIFEVMNFHHNTATPQHRNTAILNIGVNYYSFIFLV